MDKKDFFGPFFEKKVYFYVKILKKEESFYEKNYLVFYFNFIVFFIM